jgi:hypothetical protein
MVKWGIAEIEPCLKSFCLTQGVMTSALWTPVLSFDKELLEMTSSQFGAKAS